MRLCILVNCSNQHWAKGYCSKHYHIVRRHGKVVSTRKDPRPAIIEGDIAKIPLRVNARQGYAVVDKEFAYLAQFKWFLGRGNYPASGYRDENNKKCYRRLHREVMGYDSMIDHADMNKLNNRKSNLRKATYTQNAMNKDILARNTSGYKGVSWDGRRGKWVVRVANIYVGGFKTAIEAAEAYNKKALELHGDFARINQFQGAA